MKKIIANYLVVLLGFSLLPSYLIGQNKSAFEKIFEKETDGTVSDESVKFKNITKVSFYPDTLPNWFFMPPQSTQNTIYAVGVSDPDMEPLVAKEMAIHRAKALAGLYLNAKLQYYRDVYTSEKEAGKYTTYRQRFDTYFKISSTLKANDESFAVIDSHMTRYNESMILIKLNLDYNQSAPTEHHSAVGTVLFVEAQVGDAFEVQAEYDLLSAFRQPDKDIQSAHFLFREKGNKFLSNSEYLNNTIEFPVYIYKYTSPSGDKNTQPLVSYNGLWSKFTREMLRSLTLTTEQTKTHIKNLGEKNSPGLSNLAREIVSFKANLKLNGIVFERDSMKLSFNVNEILSENNK